MAHRPKTPQEKKSLSLEKDCRNSYGSNLKAARKGIPKSKQRAHQSIRRSVAQALRPGCNADQDSVDVGEAEAKTVGIIRDRKSFRKRADISLGDSIARKKKSLGTSYKNYGNRPREK